MKDLLAKELLLKTIVSCPLPEDNQRNTVPVSVSIVGTEMEEPTNLLKVIYNKPGLVLQFQYSVFKNNKLQFCREKKQVYGLQQGSHFSSTGYQF